MVSFSPISRRIQLPKNRGVATSFDRTWLSLSPIHPSILPSYSVHSCLAGQGYLPPTPLAVFRLTSTTHLPSLLITFNLTQHCRAHTLRELLRSPIQLRTHHAHQADKGFDPVHKPRLYLLQPVITRKISSLSLTHPDDPRGVASYGPNWCTRLGDFHLKCFVRFRQVRNRTCYLQTNIGSLEQEAPTRHP